MQRFFRPGCHLIKNMRPAFIAICIVTILFACKKGKKEETTIPGVHIVAQQHIAQNPDSATINTRLRGNWQLVKQNCGWAGEVDLTNKVIIVFFDSDGSYILKENSTTLASGTWVLKKVNDVWKLN